MFDIFFDHLIQLYPETSNISTCLLCSITIFLHIAQGGSHKILLERLKFSIRVASLASTSREQSTEVVEGEARDEFLVLEGATLWYRQKHPF